MTIEDIAASTAIFYSHTDENEVIECSKQSWDMINTAFNMELRREKRIVSVMVALVEGEHMVFPYIHETFY